MAGFKDYLRRPQEDIYHIEPFYETTTYTGEDLVQAALRAASPEMRPQFEEMLRNAQARGGANAFTITQFAPHLMQRDIPVPELYEQALRLGEAVGERLGLDPFIRRQLGYNFFDRGALGVYNLASGHALARAPSDFGPDDPYQQAIFEPFGGYYNGRPNTFEDQWAYRPSFRMFLGVQGDNPYFPEERATQLHELVHAIDFANRRNYEQPNLLAGALDAFFEGHGPAEFATELAARRLLGDDDGRGPLGIFYRQLPERRVTLERAINDPALRNLPESVLARERSLVEGRRLLEEHPEVFGQAVLDSLTPSREAIPYGEDDPILSRFWRLYLDQISK